MYCEPKDFCRGDIYCTLKKHICSGGSCCDDFVKRTAKPWKYGISGHLFAEKRNLQLIELCEPVMRWLVKNCSKDGAIIIKSTEAKLNDCLIILSEIPKGEE